MSTKEWFEMPIEWRPGRADERRRKLLEAQRMYQAYQEEQAAWRPSVDMPVAHPEAVRDALEHIAQLIEHHVGEGEWGEGEQAVEIIRGHKPIV